ncbi:glycosyltransferase family 2 protein [Phaeodactylibacter luteus]|uniref:Glycosyltransferase family 2 protein n=1 Tax=Phaeodactylibacter luteus TaxID=1564516 RepID=A0A5C6RMR3_9BACT|nr:glycosyltransferase family 2 protein [Phaeodactylibacter luteus]
MKIFLLPLLQIWHALSKPVIDVIIPAFNEEESIGKVIADIPPGWAREVLVCNNGSTDRTAEVAEQAGATVLTELRKGYGSACLKGMAHIASRPDSEKPDIVVFLDADYSDHPDEMPKVVAPLLEAGYDLVIGSRALGQLEAGAMMPQQIFGNWLATTLIRLIYNYHFTDLGPFRAVRYDKLLELNMQDPNFGWTVEMQVKAAKQKMKATEVPVSYRRRIGVSKVSGTVKGSILAGYKILWTIFKLV